MATVGLSTLVIELTFLIPQYDFLIKSRKGCKTGKLPGPAWRQGSKRRGAKPVYSLRGPLALSVTVRPRPLKKADKGNTTNDPGKGVPSTLGDRSPTPGARTEIRVIALTGILIVRVIPRHREGRRCRRGTSRRPIRDRNSRTRACPIVGRGSRARARPIM